jgi:hypothetical protein
MTARAFANGQELPRTRELDQQSSHLDEDRDGATFLEEPDIRMASTHASIDSGGTSRHSGGPLTETATAISQGERPRAPRPTHVPRRGMLDSVPVDPTGLDAQTRPRTSSIIVLGYN